MLLFIERYKYNLDKEVRDGLRIRDVLNEVVAVPQKETEHEYSYVGYCYSKAAKDAVFFLPKVVLTGAKYGDNTPDTVFGAKPEEIIDFESLELGEKFNEGSENHDFYKKFLSDLSIWLYRTISVYKERHDANILQSKPVSTEIRGRKKCPNNLLDVIISLQEFNRQNQDYFTFIVRNMHTGYNKIQWQKTIVKTQAIVQDESPVYLNPVNKKKVVNFDEELLVIYFSILNYIHEEHGFDFDINIHYKLISPKVIKEKYIGKNFGCHRLRQIKYKYFSDKALRIWDLCFAFFDKIHRLATDQKVDEFLLTSDFEHIFEVMIDELIGGDIKEIQYSELKEQKDGKLVDHLFIGKSLIEREENGYDKTYYIGDSKYYKRNEDRNVSLGATSVYKQYTYAKNIIQLNMDLFLKEGDVGEQPLMRDDLTEGYNPIPNFFISAYIPERGEGTKFLAFDDSEIRAQGQVHLNRQFENRLFDRDTLLLSYYDVNFLYIVSLYGFDNKSKQKTWRDYVRNEFRKKVIDTLNEVYDFYVLTPKRGMDCFHYLKDNFHLLNGKVYRPEKDGNYLVLALLKKDSTRVKELMDNNTKRIAEAVKNDGAIKQSLYDYFTVKDLEMLGEHLTVEGIEYAGTLEKQGEKNLQTVKNVLTGVVRTGMNRKKEIIDPKSYLEYSKFREHLAIAYIMEKIPTGVNLQDVKYFLPMVSGEINGYYEVEKITFNTYKDKDGGGKLGLRLKLDKYYSLGEQWVNIYDDMRPGELITMETINKLLTSKQ